MKKLAILIIPIIMLSACMAAPDLQDEAITTFEVQVATIAPYLESGQDPSTENPGQNETVQESGQTLDQRFSSLSFIPVSGNYARNTTYEDAQYTELFMLEQNNFVRIASGDMEEEVFAYNYISDDFTYLYYFDGELMAKVVYNLLSGEVKQDDGGFAEYITIDAEELKIYCMEILDRAGISPDEL